MAAGLNPLLAQSKRLPCFFFILGSECLNYSCGVGHRSPWQRFQDIFTGEVSALEILSGEAQAGKGRLHQQTPPQHVITLGTEEVKEDAPKG